jgi:hypothetical protein
MNRKWKSLLILILALVLFYMAGFPLMQLNRRMQKLRPNEDVLKKLPPELVFSTVLLGGFRSILLDFLWMRARSLQEEGKYFELVQLSDWICFLEPDIPEIWVFNAWNLSYNISVEFPTSEERWNWVYQGIKLLRDKALVYVTDSPLIYKELSWLFFNKVSGSIDQAHTYYKNAWAIIMRDAMGRFNPEELTEAPSLSELEKNPQTSNILNAFQKSGIELTDSNIWGPNFDSLPKDLKGYKGKPGFQQVELYARSRILREQLKMEPETMVEIDQKYGALDWKAAATQALYWIEQGKKKTDMQQIDYERGVYFALNHLLEWGKINFRKVGEEEIMMVSPDLRMADILNRYYREVLEQIPAGQSGGIKSSHRGFLKKVSLLAYTINDLSTARKYYRYLKEDYPDEAGSSFSSFISGEFIETIKEGSVQEIGSLIFGTLYQSFWYLAAGEESRYAGLQSMARIIYRRICEEDKRFMEMFPDFESLSNSVADSALEQLPPALADSLRKKLGK